MASQQQQLDFAVNRVVQLECRVLALELWIKHIMAGEPKDEMYSFIDELYSKVDNIMRSRYPGIDFTIARDYKKWRNDDDV